MASNPSKTGPAMESKSAGQKRQPPKTSSDSAGFLRPGGPGVQPNQMHHAGQTPSIKSAASRAHLPPINTRVSPAPGTARGTPESGLQPQSAIGSATGPQLGQRHPTPATRTGGNEGKERERKFAEVSSLAAPVVDMPARSTAKHRVIPPAPTPRTGGDEGKQRERQFAEVSSLAPPVVKMPAKTTTKHRVIPSS